MTSFSQQLRYENSLFDSIPPLPPPQPPPPSLQLPLSHSSMFSQSPIEVLDLPELLKNPHVQSMDKNWQEASKQVVQALKTQQALFQENATLQLRLKN